MLSKMSKENLEMLSYAKIAELYLKENKKPMNTADLRANHSVKIDIDDIYEEVDSEEEDEDVIDDENMSEEDNYDDDYTDDSDADLIDDDYADLTIVDDEELEDEN